MVKNPSVMQETQIQSLGWKDTLEKQGKEAKGALGAQENGE